MERKVPAETGHQKTAHSANAWAVTALMAWSGLLVAVAAFSGVLNRITSHDVLIGLLGIGFILMAFVSITLARQDLRAFLASSSHDSRRR